MLCDVPQVLIVGGIRPALAEQEESEEGGEGGSRSRSSDQNTIWKRTRRDTVKTTSSARCRFGAARRPGLPRYNSTQPPTASETIRQPLTSA